MPDNQAVKFSSTPSNYRINPKVLAQMIASHIDGDWDVEPEEEDIELAKHIISIIDEKVIYV